jgi:hypothetical protein
LLVADVVLQALNAEGPIDWPKVREVVLAPQEMTATDVGRYQLYSRQGALGSLASVDLTRAHLQQTVQRATAATETLLELQREWAALEGVAERLLTKGETFQHLTLEMERGVNEDRALEAAPAGRGRAAGTRAASGRAALYEREQPSAAASRIASPRAGAGRHAAYRRSGAPQSRSWGPGRSWARVLALVGTGGAIAVAAIFAAQRWLPTRAHDPEPQQVVVAPEQHDADADAEQEGAQPPSDVAKERAALDALPNE